MLALIDSVKQSLTLVSRNTQQQLIANAVDSTMRSVFPTKHTGLCYLYAIHGANILSLLYERHYIPVAGVALIEAGDGKFIEMLDNQGFDRKEGGTFHCWIESDDSDDTELVDLTYRHNAEYALTLGVDWRKQNQPFLWGLKQDIVVPMERMKISQAFHDGKVWFHKSEKGIQFLTRHMHTHAQEHSRIFSHVLRSLALELATHLENQDTSID